MSEEDPAPKPTRPWREIKADIAKERNSEKAVQLLIELDRALLEQQGPHITKRSS
jgi:hypothetical protein